MLASGKLYRKGTHEIMGRMLRLQYLAGVVDRGEIETCVWCSSRDRERRVVWQGSLSDSIQLPDS